MITLFAIVIVAVFQSALLLGTIVLLIVAHRRARRLQVAQQAAVYNLREPLRRLMMREDRGHALAGALSHLDPRVATQQLILIAGTRLSRDDQRTLAAQVRPSHWLNETVAGADSTIWWKRMEAARLLAVVGGPDDRPVMARLVTDPHPAVASAATDVLGQHADATLIQQVILDLAFRPSVVRQRQMRALRNHAPLATSMLVPLLSVPASDDVIRARVQLAETLGTPAALKAVIRFAAHENPSVRATVARALRTCYLPAGVDAAFALLHDSQWPVRAAAARALGGLRAVHAIAQLRAAMGDESWWVRFRAALALRSLGPDGEAALASATSSPDRYTRDMAVVVRGLSEGSRLELSA